MKKLLFLSSLLLVTLLQLTIVDSKLSIVSPHQLAAQFQDETIPFVLANYGNAPYGAHFVGGLALASERNGCSKIDHFQAGELEFDQNIIAVIQMGGCQSTVKTRNAQLAGAKMVILVSDTEELPEIFGSAVGTDSIHIPTILIPKAEGNRLIKFIEKLPYPPLNPEDIIPIVSINFPYEAKGDTVALDFWLTSSDEASYNFLSNFSAHVAQNMKTFNFTPHFVTWDCYICKRTNYRVPITDDCISSGRYCAPDPDTPGGPLQGRDILLEDIRQKCAWKTNPFVWWNYIDSYNRECRNNGDIKKCSEKLFGGYSSNVESCVSGSFLTPEGGKSDNDKVDDNRILSEEKELQLEYDITEFPVLLINHKPFVGDLENIDEVMEEICKNLKTTTGECRKYAASYEGQTSASGPGAGVVTLVVILLIISGVSIVLFFRRVHKRKEALEISMEANNMVSRYMAVKDVPTAREEDESETHA